jgi:hypothetical protein
MFDGTDCTNETMNDARTVTQSLGRLQGISKNPDNILQILSKHWMFVTVTGQPF